MSNKKSEFWSVSCLASVGGAHQALTYLYDGLETGDKIRSVPLGDKLSVQRAECSSIQQAHRVFTQHCLDLCTRLSSPTQRSVRLPLGSVLNLVSRCLQVTFNEVRSVPSLQELSGVLPGIHRSILTLLAHLIVGCGSNLLPKSRQILDACLQVLVSTEKMEKDNRGELRASVYRVLSLWLETTGLGKHYLSKAKDFHRELMADIAQIQTPTQVPSGKTPAVDAVEPEVKKKKGKKKGSRRAESYLVSSYADSVQGVLHALSPHTVAATMGALHISQLVARRGEFVPLQTLMRSVLDTAIALQRQPPHPLSPYTDPGCRSSLYTAVFAMASVPLECTSNTPDTVAHFQLTSRALSLVRHASFHDPSVTTQLTCKNLASSCRAVGLVSRPIVRKVLPEEQVEMRDVAEMDRQMEELREENERLKRKVLETEVENQQQTRRAGELTEELDGLRKAKVDPHVALRAHFYADQLHSPSDSEEEEMEGTEQMEDAEGDQDGGEEGNSSSGKEHSQAETETTSAGVSEGKVEKAEAVEGPLSRKEKRKRNEKDKKSKANDTEVGSNGGSVTEKRPISSLEDEPSAEIVKDKKSRLDVMEEEKSVDVQAMLLDFVDADPDSD